MQITLSLPDDIGQELKTLPDPERFVADLLRAALQCRKHDEASEDLSDLEASEAAYQRYLRGEEKTVSLADMEKKFGLAS
jgi:hypothetical protein